jgi:hypothetical protein
VSLLLRPFGLRSKALLQFVAVTPVFMVSFAYDMVALWRVVNDFTYDWLNTCVDKNVASDWSYEQSYRPSAEYVSCTSDVRYFTFMVVSLAIGLLICAVVALVSVYAEKFINDHTMSIDGSWPRIYSFGAVRTCSGIVAIILSVYLLSRFFPVS